VVQIGKRGLRVNNGIRAVKVRVIDQSEQQVGILDTEEARKMAVNAGLDLVEVSPQSEPPVCRIMDYSKWLYQQKRRLREAHKKHQHHNTTLKGIRLRPETDKHDLDIKLKHAREFLEKGHRVQFTVFFRGRQVLHKERGYAVLDQVIETLKDLAKPDQEAKLAHKRLTMVLVPR
jgi:translation initiation factor IF-3